jgi:hypothetical protein
MDNDLATVSLIVTKDADLGLIRSAAFKLFKIFRINLDVSDERKFYPIPRAWIRSDL